MAGVERRENDAQYSSDGHGEDSPNSQQHESFHSALLRLLDFLIIKTSSQLMGGEPLLSQRRLKKLFRDFL